jgi:predicted nucleotidyltransferase
VRVTFPAFSRDELVERLREGLASLAVDLPVQRAILFGSWAAGRATAYSDIDVLVIYADPPREDAFPLVRTHLALRGLEPHVYAETEASHIQPTLERMTRGGMTLL